MEKHLSYNKSGRSLTERFEGCRLSAYQDVRGIWTIGYGHTSGVHEGMTCTQEQADRWLQQDTSFAAEAVNRLVHIQLTQDEFNALVDFVFNLGIGAFQRSTLLRFLNAGEFVAAAGQFSLWDRAGGKVVAGLLRRRIAERQEFEGGEKI